MKTVLTAGVTFTPGSRTLDFSGVAGFDRRRLLAVIHVASGRLLYATGTPGLGAFAGSVLTLTGDLTGLDATDPLTILYEAAAADTGFATDATLSGVMGTDGTSPPAIAGTGVRGWLRAVYERLAGTLTVSGSAAVGSAPANPPLSVSGVDAGGLKRHLLTDALGVLQAAVTRNAQRVTASGALGAQGASVTLAVDGMATGILQLAGTWVGTVALKGSVDDGATYFAINMTPFGSGLSGPSVASAAANGQWEVPVGGLTHLQATMTAWTSGSATARLVGSSAGKMVRVKAPSTDPLPVADASNAPFSGATAMTAGTAVPAGRSIGINCTASGVMTLTLAAGGTIALPVIGQSGGLWQTFPFAATQYSFDATATGAVYNLA